MTVVGHSRLGGASCRSSQCPQCPVSDGRPEKGGLSLWADSVEKVLSCEESNFCTIKAGGGKLMGYSFRLDELFKQ